MVPQTVFDANYFYCHVEPQFIFAVQLRNRRSLEGDPANGCHFNPSAVSGMALINHPAVDCGGGDVPVDLTQIGIGQPRREQLRGGLARDEQRLHDGAALRAAERPHGMSAIRPPAVRLQHGGGRPERDVITLLSTWASK